MSAAVSFVIPGTPEGKRRPRVDGRGAFVRVHSHGDDIKRERVIRALAREAMAGRPAFTGPVRVSIDAVFEVTPSWSKKRKAEALDGVYHTAKPDSDNVTKSVLDGLNPDSKAKNEWEREPFCLLDDAQVAEQMTRKRYGSPARIEVTVQAIGPMGLI